jgi:hypothetical protein
LAAWLRARGAGDGADAEVELAGKAAATTVP